MIAEMTVDDGHRCTQFSNEKAAIFFILNNIGMLLKCIVLVAIFLNIFFILNNIEMFYLWKHTYKYIFKNHE